MWAAILSDRLTVVALVSHYLTNKLIVHDPLPGRTAPEGVPTFTQRTMRFQEAIRY